MPNEANNVCMGIIKAIAITGNIFSLELAVVEYFSSDNGKIG